MPTEYWYPPTTAPDSLPSGWNGLNNGGGANKNASLRPGGGRQGPMTHDDGSTYVAKPTGTFGPENQAANIDWPGPMVAYTGVLTAGGRMASDGVYFVQRKQYMVGSGGGTGTVIYDSGLVGGTWATNGPTDISNGPTYRPGGGAWVLTDFDDQTTIFAGVTMNTGDVNATGFCSSLFGQIGYTPPAGGFAFLLNLTGLGALPFVGALTDFTHFRKYLSWRRRFHPRHTIMEEDEVREAWADIKAYRSPKFFFPAVA